MKIALDWTPNTNHTGFFVAQIKGFYAELGLTLDIIDPSTDNYQTTPAKKLEFGEVDLAIAPTESILSYRLKDRPAYFKAIAAILQEDLSAIATLPEIGRPRQLDGKIYGSYQARYEDHIVRQLIKNDGGEGNIKVVYPEKLGIWNTLLSGQVDATWIFRAWEGIEAEGQGVALNYHLLKDYGIDYGYSPVIVARAADLEDRADVIRAFLYATRRGFVFAQEHPGAAAEILHPYVPPHDRERIDLQRSQAFINPFYGNAENWGRMESERFRVFMDWLWEKGMLPEKIEADSVFTNALID